MKDNELTEVQHIIFLRLVKQYWLTACPLPSADTRLARIARVSNTEFRRNRDTVLAYFIETDEGFEPDIYRDALARAQEIAEKRREAGRKGGQISGAKRQAFASKTPSKGQARRAQAYTDTVTVKTTSQEERGVSSPDGGQNFSGLKAVSGGAA